MRNLSLVIAGFFQAHVKPEGFFFKEMGGGSFLANVFPMKLATLHQF